MLPVLVQLPITRFLHYLDIPLFLFHILQWMDVDSKFNVKEINRRWSKPENIDSWGQLVIKHTENSIMQVTEAPKSGILQNGCQG